MAAMHLCLKLDVVIKWSHVVKAIETYVGLSELVLYGIIEAIRLTRKITNDYQFFARAVLEVLPDQIAFNCALASLFEAFSCLRRQAHAVD